MRKINYKCPSCGGKIEYNDNNILMCIYCNKTFDPTIKTEFNVNNLIEKMDIYTYFCSNCNYKYKTKSKIEGNLLCPNCKGHLEENKQIVNGLIPMSMTQEQAKKRYYNELKKIKKFIPKEFFESDLNLEYIRCRVYEGYVKVSAQRDKSISKEYQIYNLPVPTSDQINYNQKKALLYIPLETHKAIYSKDKLEKIIDIKSLNVDFSKETEIEEIKKACIKNFRRFKFIYEEEVTAEAFVETKHNFYLPAYTTSTIYNGKTYHNYMFCIDDNVLICFDFPKFDEKKYQKYQKTISNENSNQLMILLFLILFLGIMVLNSIFIMPSSKENPGGSFTVIMALWIIMFFIIACTSHIMKKKNKQKKKILLLFENKEITEDEYFEQVISKYNKV